jgi:hypothetical protein
MVDRPTAAAAWRPAELGTLPAVVAAARRPPLGLPRARATPALVHTENRHALD